MKISLAGLSSRMDLTEERVSELEYNSVERTPTENKKKKVK